MPKLKRQLSKLSPLSIGIIVVFAAVMTYFLFQAFAATGTGTMYTSPAGTQSATTGQSFTVNVRISSSVPTVCAQADMSYPTDKLQVTGQSYAGSPYTTEGQPATNSGGILRILRCAPSGTIPAGDQLFAQVTFKAVAAGSASINFAGSSILTSGDDQNPSVSLTRNGVTYNISNPATPPPSTPPASSGGGSSSSGSSSSGSAASTGSSSKPATGTRAASNPKATDGSTNPNASSAPADDGAPDSTAPGSDASTATTTDENGQVTSRSVSTVAITILDSKNKPIEGAEVTINGQTAKTDKNGVARFESVPSGDQKVAVKYNGKKTSKVVHVKGASTQASPELFNVAIARNKFNPAILLAPLVVLVAAAVLFLRPWTRFATASAGGASPDAIDQIVTSDQQFTPTTPQTPASPSKEGPGMVIAPDQQSDAPTPSEPTSPDPAPADSDSPEPPTEPEDSELEPATPPEEPTVEPSSPSEETPVEPTSDDEPPATPPEASSPESQPPAEDESDEPPRQ